jgi:hypothetical protein
MPRATGYLLIWRAERRAYELYDSSNKPLLTITPGEQAWFAWLDSIPSFTFQGQQGQLTARKEARQRGGRLLVRLPPPRPAAQQEVSGPDG